ncbi:MAG: XRE family transcriptional regulator [Desulfobulbaceae bacterium]|nr:XRE family transcriptional regulator [Desulfobulbaceae bacterium]
MDSSEFLKSRKILDKTQKQLAELLGISIKAVHSYEQGWRKVPSHVERQVFFLLSRTRANEKTIKPCWVVKKCPPQRRKHCPAWEFQAGKLCWFINGTICECKSQRNWQEKMKICRSCEVLADLL